jgi:hypothetical protein
MLSLFALALAIVPQALRAQPSALWARTYGGGDDDFGWSTIETTDGSYLVVGYTTPYGGNYEDIVLIWTDHNGDLLRTLTLGGSGSEVARSVILAADGGYLVTGSTCSYGAGDWDVYLIRFDANGDLLWIRSYGIGDDDYGCASAQTADGGYLTVGYTNPFGPEGSEAFLIRTDSNGDLLWTRTYGGSADDHFYSIEALSDDSYLIVGSTDSFGAGSLDVWLIHIASSGDPLWSRTYGGPSNEQGYAVEASWSGYIVVGYTESYGSGDQDVYIIWTDTSGDTLLTTTCGGPNDDVGYSIAGSIVAGETQSYGAGGWDLLLTSIDCSWISTYGGERDDGGRSIAQTTNGAYIVAGYTKSFGVGGSDIYLLKLVDEPPNVTITLLPDATTVERGGTLGYTVEVTNNTVEDQTFEYWSDVYLWSGEPYKKNPVFGPKVVTVKAGMTRSGHLTHKVPNNAPLKTYTLCGRIGFHPDIIWNEDCFEFTVVEPVYKP